MADGALAHFRPWLEDIRKEKPHQLADDIEQLFLEKSVTGASAWNRLFDETIASLRFEVEGVELTLEPTLARLSDADETERERAAKALAKTFAANLRVFTLITNTLAKDKEISDQWRGFSDIADSRHLANRVEREVVDALAQAVTGNYARLSHRYYKLKARWFGKKRLAFWDRNAPLPEVPQQNFFVVAGSRDGSRPRMPTSLRMSPTSPVVFLTRGGSMQRSDRVKLQAPSLTRRRLPHIPMCSSTISASRAML